MSEAGIWMVSRAQEDGLNGNLKGYISSQRGGANGELPAGLSSSCGVPQGCILDIWM